MAKFENKIPNEDWMKVDPTVFGPDAIAANAKVQATQAMLNTDKLAFESAVAKALVASGQLAEGRLPIFTRFGDMADPSKHSKAVGTNGAGKAKKQTFVLASLYGPDKKPKK